MLQQRHQVGQRRLPPVDLAVLQRGRGGAGVRQDVPLDPVEGDPLAAGQPVRRLGPRDVVGEFLECRRRAGHPFVALEAHRAGADILADLLERIGLRDPLRHDEQAGRAALAQREQQLRVGLVQPEAERAIVHRLQRIQPLLDRHAHGGVAHHPAADAGDGVARQHRGAVVELQALAQLEGPGLEVGADLVALDHLRLRLELVVDAVQHVPDQQGAVAHDVLRGPDGVEIGQGGLRHEAQHLAVPWGVPWVARRAGQTGHGEAARRRKRTRGGGLQKVPTMHRLFCPCSRPVRAVALVRDNSAVDLPVSSLSRGAFGWFASRVAPPRLRAARHPSLAWQRRKRQSAGRREGRRPCPHDTVGTSLAGSGRTPVRMTEPDHAAATPFAAGHGSGDDIGKVRKIGIGGAPHRQAVQDMGVSAR